MSIQCPNCNKEYDITLFQYDKNIKCDCGETVELTKEINLKNNKITEYINYRELQSAVDKTCSLIMNTVIPEKQIQDAITEAKNLCKKLFPYKLYLFNLIYMSRFKRLSQQFRDTGLTVKKS